MSREEEAILWGSIERIPDAYREPLVLFYREHQSVERVAAALDLSEDAVKQRLSRGRKLLQEEVLAFVEGALERTNPGKAFTLAVLAALPTVTLPAKAATLGATLGATAAKGGAAAKAAGAMGMLAPALIVFGNYVSYRIGLDEARSDEERRLIRTFHLRNNAMTLGALAMFAAVMFWVHPSGLSRGSWFALFFTAFVVLYFLTMFVSAPAWLGAQRRQLSGILAREHAGVIPKPAFDYRSHATLLGLPLVHVRLGDRFDSLQKPIKAWIAVGNYAFGGLFAFGGFVVAPVAIGFCGVGLLSFAAIAIGPIALGAAGLGIWAFGGLAVGWETVGSYAIACQAALGNLAIARDFAVGNVARALQANTPAAKQFMMQSWFFRTGAIMGRHSLWLNLLWVGPLCLQWRIIARRRMREAAASR